MDRKATRFIHRLAERLSDNSDVVPDSLLLKKTFKEAVESMQPGKLRQELLSRFGLYFKRLLHSIHKTTSGLRKSTATDGESSTPPATAPPPKKVQSPALFNLYAREGERLKDLPSAQRPQGKREVLSRLCATTGLDGFKLIQSHLLGDKVTYRELKELSVVMIGQHHPEVVLRFLSFAVKSLGLVVDKALESRDKESCAELDSFISQLLILARFRCRLTGASFPRNFKPTIECIQSAFLSMAIDLSAVVSRSSVDSHKRSRQMVSQVLLHLSHSPPHLLDVLIQITSSSEDAVFLAPLYKRILCDRPVLSTNRDFIKFVYAVRDAKRRLYSVMPSDIDSLIQEACHRTPPNLVVWLQETAPQWLSKVRETSKVNGTKAITKFLLEGLDEGQFEELISDLTSTDKAPASGKESEEATRDLFFVDKSQDVMQGVLPDEDGVIPEWQEAESDLEDEINLADELLAELDREIGVRDERERVTNGGVERDSDEEKDKDAMEGEEDSDGMMDMSVMTSGRKSPELFPSLEEISFEEQRALDLDLRQGSTPKSPLGKGSANTEGRSSKDGVDTTPRKKRDRLRDGSKTPRDSNTKWGRLSGEEMGVTPKKRKRGKSGKGKDSPQRGDQRGSQDSVGKQQEGEMMVETSERGQVIGQSDGEVGSILEEAGGVGGNSPPKLAGEGWNVGGGAEHSNDDEDDGNSDAGRGAVIGMQYIHGRGTSPRKQTRKARRRVASEGVSPRPGEPEKLSPFRRQHLRKTSLSPKVLQKSLGDAQMEPSNDFEIEIPQVNGQTQGPDVAQGTADPSDSETEVVFNLQRAADRERQLKIRKGPPNPKMARAQQRYFSPKMLRRTRMREAKWGEVMQRGRESGEQEAGGQDGGDQQREDNQEVIPSSKLWEQRELAQQQGTSRDRLSFPPLPPGRLMKKSFSLSRKRGAESKTPNLILAVEESDEGSVDDRGGRIDNGQSKVGRSGGDVFGKSGPTRGGTEGEVIVPRRSQRVRVSSTSSVESSRSDLRERRKTDSRGRKMNLRSARPANR